MPAKKLPGFRLPNIESDDDQHIKKKIGSIIYMLEKKWRKIRKQLESLKKKI